jgi:hypothetical protein
LVNELLGREQQYPIASFYCTVEVIGLSVAQLMIPKPEGYVEWGLKNGDFTRELISMIPVYFDCFVYNEFLTRSLLTKRFISNTTCKKLDFASLSVKINITVFPMARFRGPPAVTWL